MSWVLTTGSLLNLVGGAVVVLFGLWVATLRPRSTASKALAGFSAAFGVQAVFYYGLTWDDPWFPIAAACSLAGAGMLVILALRFPAPIERGDARRLLLAAAVATLYVIVGLRGHVVGGLGPEVQAIWGIPPGGEGNWLLWNVCWNLLVGAVLFALFLFVLRAETAKDRTGFASYALFSAPLALYPGIAWGALYWMDDGETPALALLTMGLLGLLAVLWLRLAWRGLDPRTCRTVAWVVLGGMLTGLGVSWASGGFPTAAAGGLFAGFRTLMVLLLGYAILRHQLLGMDVKLRWGISRSTVAGIFIAVFFIASEVAQQYFGDEFDNSYLGIAAAGLLVVGIAPLQRFADRIAASAVPPAAPADLPGPWSAPPRDAGGPPREALPDPEAAYRAAVRASLRDGVLTRREEHHLAEVAEHLGLGPRTAWALREAVEAERRDPQPLRR